MAGLNGVFQLSGSVVQDCYEGAPAHEGGSRVYGGHTLAQALLAAFKTLDDSWVCHAYHAQFVRPASPDEVLLHSVERTSDGRNFAVRRVVTRQSGKIVMTATGSFQNHIDGADFQVSPPVDVADAEAFQPERARYTVLFDELVAQGGSPQQLPSGIDGRLTDPQDFLAPTVKSARHPMWLRVEETPPAGAPAQQVALAYCSDFNFNEPVLRPHGYSWVCPTPPGITTLEHSLWFHRPSDISRWHLCDAEVVSTSGGRGHVRGLMFDEDRRLIASLAQQARFVA